MEEPNTPSVNESIASSTITMYSPGQIAWATCLGAPIAGCWLLALNYRRLGDVTAAYLCWIFGSLGTVLLLALGIAFDPPEWLPEPVITVACAFGMYQCARALQGKAYDDRLANGAKKGSGWVATGIGILCLILILTTIPLPFIALLIFDLLRGS